MIRGLAVTAAAMLLALSSCRTAPAGVVLPSLNPGAAPPGEAATLRGELVRSGACLALREGGGTIVIIWPRTVRAREGGGTVVVVWPFRRTDPPVRTGEEVEMAGIIIVTDNISGFARIPDEPGCRSGRYLLLREAQPAR